MATTLLIGIVLLAASFAASTSVRSFIISFGTAFVLGMLMCLLDSKTKGLADLVTPGMAAVGLFYAVVFHGLVSFVRLVKMGRAYRYAVLLVFAVLFPVLMFARMGKQISSTNLVFNTLIFSLLIMAVYFVISKLSKKRVGALAN